MKVLLGCDKCGKLLAQNTMYKRNSLFINNDKKYLLVNKASMSYTFVEKTACNGKVCAMCDINKVEDISKIYNHFVTISLCQTELIKKAALTKEQLFTYHPKYALYLDNIKAIEPIKISFLAKDKNKPAYKYSPYWSTPRNMCYAWCLHDGDFEHFLIIFFHSEDLCKILNGEKVIDTRRIITNKLKELIK